LRETLFRQQVVDEKKNRVIGQPLTRPPAALRVTAILLISIFITASLFLVCGSYSRRERSSGILVPNQGAVKVVAKRSGAVSAIHVQDGDEVKVNTPLFTLYNDKTLGAGEVGHHDVLSGLEGLALNLKARLDALPARKAQDSLDIKGELEKITMHLNALRSQKTITQKRLAIQKDRRQRATTLADERLISKDAYQELSDAVLQAQSHEHEAEQAILAAEARKSELESKGLRLDAVYKEEEGSLLQQLAATQERIAALNLDQSQVLVAPVSGRITSLQAYMGLNVDLSKPLAIILPEGSQLEAHLFVPTRAIGFLKVGQKVLLHYEAFPSQKYGVQAAFIENVSRSALNPSEVSEVDLGPTQEAYYRVKARLEKNSIQAFGQDIALQSGMRLTADIILERRSLLEWILEPLYRAKE